MVQDQGHWHKNIVMNPGITLPRSSPQFCASCVVGYLEKIAKGDVAN